ncbi:MAG: transposase [Rhodobacteraceae bacterium]|nr:transposase [Paracoccaceae bacterium]MCP5342537.1 transposase [Paracoccaceae bacterium]
MPNYRRFRVAGASYFFTVNLAQRGRSTLTDNIEVLRAAYRATVADHPVRCDAMVVLPDHIHAVWTMPEGDADYSLRWGAIKARFTRGLRRVGFHPTNDIWPIPRSPSKIAKGDAGIWQRRFWEHMIRDDQDYAAHVRYCWLNPVEHGLVENPEDWPYSSARGAIRAGRRRRVGFHPTICADRPRGMI